MPVVFVSLLRLSAYTEPVVRYARMTILLYTFVSLTNRIKITFLYLCQVRKKKQIGLDFLVDKLTNSIENVVTGDSFPTDITLISSADLKTITKKNSWVFDWKDEFKQPERDVYKLTIVNNQAILQGLISLEIKPDHVYMHLVESAPFNKGKTKVCAGVPGNLVAFACKLSFQRGHD